MVPLLRISQMGRGRGGGIRLVSPIWQQHRTTPAVKRKIRSYTTTYTPSPATSKHFKTGAGAGGGGGGLEIMLALCRRVPRRSTGSRQHSTRSQRNKTTPIRTAGTKKHSTLNRVDTTQPPHRSRPLPLFHQSNHRFCQHRRYTVERVSTRVVVVMVVVVTQPDRLPTRARESLA